MNPANQRQTVYQVTVDTQSGIIYNNYGRWAVDSDNQMDGSLVQSIGSAIESYQVNRAQL